MRGMEALLNDNEKDELFGQLLMSSQEDYFVVICAMRYKSTRRS